MNIKEKKAAPEMLHNPLLGPNFKLHVTRGIRQGKYEEHNGVRLPMHWFADREPKVSVFVHGDKQTIIMNLSDRALRMYLFIIYNLSPGADFIEITQARYQRKSSLKSRTTYTEAKAELIRYGFMVASHIKGIYWINPEYIFHGSRPMKYPNRLEVDHDFSSL